MKVVVDLQIFQLKHQVLNVQNVIQICVVMLQILANSHSSNNNLKCQYKLIKINVLVIMTNVCLDPSNFSDFGTHLTIDIYLGNWQQSGPPPTTYIPQQPAMIPPQMYHPQQAIPPQSFYVAQQYQQTAQYVPMNYSQGSIPQQVNNNKQYEMIYKYFIASRK